MEHRCLPVEVSPVIRSERGESETNRAKFRRHMESLPGSGENVIWEGIGMIKMNKILLVALFLALTINGHAAANQENRNIGKKGEGEKRLTGRSGESKKFDIALPQNPFP